MSTVSIPFQSLAERIQQQEAELAKLRQELESRSSQLSKLTRRKDELQAELAKVEEEIGAVTHASVPIATASNTKASAKGVASKPAKGLSLPQYLVNLVRKANAPITAKELAETVVRNKFPSTSSNLADIVKTRVYDLVKKGVLKRLDDSGLVLAQTASPKIAVSKAPVDPKQNGKKTKAKSTSAPSQPVAAQGRTLHDVLTHVMANSSKPLTGQELAECVIENGYESKSKDFVNVIYSSLGKLPNVERVPGKGYRLKKGKGTGTK